jgi:UDP-glucose 4-epimerase
MVLHLLRDIAISRIVSMDVNLPKEWFMKSMGNHADKFLFVRGDVADLESILDTLKKNSIDRIIHTAFIMPGVLEFNPRLGIKVNLLGTCNVFEAARLMSISRVVYTSSVGVYGPQNEYGDREVNEDDQQHPENGYGINKQLIEILAAQYAEQYGIKFSATRPFLGYGHGGTVPLLIKQFSDLISLPAVGKPFSVEADGTQQFSLSSADDVAELTRILVKAPSSPHPVYNVGGPPTSMRDLAAAVRKYLPEARIEFGHQRPPENPGRFGLPWKASCIRAREDFGFSLMPLEESVLVHINDARLEAGLEPLH